MKQKRARICISWEFTMPSFLRVPHSVWREQ